MALNPQQTANSKAVAKTTSAPKAPPSRPPHLDISLPGESTESVPVYDTCNTVRAGITELLSPDPNMVPTRKPYTKKALAEQMGDITSQSLQRFRDHTGGEDMSGAEMKAYYLGYVFLEKLRLYEGREKTEARIAAEDDFGEKGRELRDPTRKRGGTKGIWVRPGEDPNDFLTEEEKAKGLFFRERKSQMREVREGKARIGDTGNKGGKKGG